MAQYTQIYAHRESFIDMVDSFVGNLDEAQQRQFFALEAHRIGYGGKHAVIEHFGSSNQRLKRGEEELLGLLDTPAGSTRFKGAGRVLIEHTHPEILDAIDEIIQSHIAGDPMNADVQWTDLQITAITQKLAENTGYKLSKPTVKRLVKQRLVLEKP